MKPRGPLMMEHRIIEKVLHVVNDKITIMNEKNYDPFFIDAIVDFIRTYADRTHHGKEEDILFKELEKKELDTTNKALMLELIDEHIQARNKVKQIIELNKKFKKGDTTVFSEIVAILKWLISFYPIHIKKEDDVFFPDTEIYFTNDELDKMLSNFWEFDRLMIHEKYQNFLKEISQ